ncbi:AAA family ATPase [Hoyosella sp. YIM 151337]|uniref:ATP-dependent DNA helicase n=1 Tax=Hoyosella sp. YIM 151337 TaxID=2992742 RepID=UPI0022357A8D|nr:AAA family ATPase [Hoyosella sp. YIM 151337]MCW4353428.1 AAA family ATPase [Hoyosella sp. YIM 151337]
MLTRHGETRYTTLSVLRAEQALLDATSTPTTHFASHAQLRATGAAVKKTTGRGLNGGQWEIARHFCLSGAQVAVATGPAGAGKTTAMKLVADTWTHSGRDVIALAPSAVAADTLGSEIGAPAATLASLTYPYRGRLDGIPAGTIPRQIQPGTMLLVDEAAMASLPDLTALQEIAQRTGAVIRLLGDPAQLDAVETGGTLRLLADHTRAPELDTVVRFGDDHAQAAASLQLRTGNPQGLALYAQRGWIHDGTRDDLLEQATTAYLTDRNAGRSSIVLAATRDDARALNELLQAATHTTTTSASTAATTGAAADGTNNGGSAGGGGRVVGLCDGTTARVGDTIVTRHNDPTVRVKAGSRPGERVRNGDLWTITTIGEDGSIGARNLASRGTVTLPAGYVTAHVELGYACTIHRAQGVTVDTTHALITGHTSRAGLYVAATRGRSENHLYVPTDTLDIDTEPVHLSPSRSEGEPMTVLERLTTVLERDQGQRSATETLRGVLREAENPQRLHDAYTTARDALTRDYLDWLIDRSLPAAITETMRAHEDTHAALYARLTALTHHGHDTTRLLTHAIHTHDLTTTPDVNTLLLQHLPHPAPDTPAAASTPQTPGTPGTSGAETPAAPASRDSTKAGPVLGVLPPRHPGMDHQLADYARTAHHELTQHTAATPAPGQRVDAVVAAELRGNPVRQLSDQQLRRIASGHDPQRGTDATIVMAGHSALTATEHDHTRARDDLARLTQQHTAWQNYTRAAQHADSLNTQRHDITREIRRLETERGHLGMFARARRRELDTTLAKLTATHSDLDNQAKVAWQHAHQLKPSGPPVTAEQITHAENHVTATAAQTATARASHIRRAEQLHREQHHRQAAAQQELHRRNKLTPEHHAQEQRLRADLTRQKRQTRPTPALDHEPSRSPGRSLGGHGIGD